MEDLLLSTVANAAGVVENVGSIFGPGDFAITFFEQDADDLFRIVCVHLAAERLDVKGFFHGIPIVREEG
jgi:hypothetical protein